MDLMSFITLLLSLADAAEGASGRSRRVRRNVLSIMPRAEAAAQAAFIRWMHHYGAPLTPQALCALLPAANAGDEPEDALHIAARFRALAFALSHLIAWADYFARRLNTIVHTRQLGVALSVKMPVDGSSIPALPPFDTS